MTKIISNIFGGHSQNGKSVNRQSEKEIQMVALEQRLATAEQRMATLEQRLSDMENTLTDTLMKDKFTLQTKVEDSQTKDSESMAFPIDNKEEQKSNRQRFYMAAPSTEGFFSAFSEYEQIGKSIYMLTTMDGVNGTFVMLDTADAIATAMISVSQFIKTVCKIENTTASHPKHIITKEEGCAVKEEGRWHVIRKAVVLFK
jgi:TolA-binding protein